MAYISFSNTPVKKVEEEMKLTKTYFFGRTYDVRYTIDNRNESLGKKIREATKMKIPFVFIVGPKDVEANKVSIRWLEDGTENDAIDFGSIREYLIENIERSFYTDKEFFGLDE